MRENQSGRSAAFISGMGAGAALMYFLDPQRGRRRRASLRDQATHLITEEKEIVQKGMRDLSHRGEGIVARLRPGGKPIDDDVLLERLRSQIGRWVSHPRALDLEVTDGHVTLKGPVLSEEVQPLLRRVRAVRGVRQVENQLEPHETSESVPALQGGPRRSRAITAWSPAMRLVGMGAGMAGAAYGLQRGGLSGAGLILFGGGLLLRSFTNQPTRQIFGIGSGDAVHIQKSLIVEAPVARVFEFWSRLENFPQFMEHVQALEPIGPNRSRWTVAGPAGAPVSFEAEVIAYVPEQAIGWRTLPEQPVKHSGLVRFERLDDANTRVQVQMSYSPPGGAVGHAVARLFGSDPKTAMDEDLIRMKSLLEEGKTRSGGRPVHLHELH